MLRLKRDVCPRAKRFRHQNKAVGLISSALPLIANQPQRLGAGLQSNSRHNLPGGPGFGWGLCFDGTNGGILTRKAPPLLRRPRPRIASNTRLSALPPVRFRSASARRPIQIFIHPFSSFPPLNAIKKIAHTPAARARSTTKVCIFLNTSPLSARP